MKKNHKILFSIAMSVCVICAAGLILLKQNFFWKSIGSTLHKNIINHYAGEYKFDPLFILAIVKVESNFQKHAQSSAGAVGLMQILPSTAREIAQELGIKDLSEEDLKIPDINIHIGFHYLSKLRDKYNDNKIQMLAAYNAGFNHVEEWKNDKSTFTIDDIKYPETKEFVMRVLSNYQKLKEMRRIKNLLNQ